MASHTMEVTTRLPNGKRGPSDDLEGEQRLAKRFDLMNLENRGGRLHIPLSGASTSTAAKQARKPQSVSDVMQIEETKDRIFIHDLEQEAAEIESDEEHPIFLPDIEKLLSRVPKSVLVGDDDIKSRENLQMVLYKVPTSLTVPEATDSVRKVIMEARQRARDSQALRIPAAPKGFPSPAQGSPTGPATQWEDDPDAMDIY